MRIHRLFRKVVLAIVIDHIVVGNILIVQSSPKLHCRFESHLAGLFIRGTKFELLVLIGNSTWLLNRANND